MALVLWSGGLDSTKVLIDLLIEEREREEKRKEPEHYTLGPHNFDKAPEVRALTVVHDQVLHGKRQQEAARVKIKDKLYSMGFNFKHTVVHVQNEGDFGVEWNGGLIQPKMWIVQAITYLRRGEAIYFGYHHGDDFWHYAEAMKDVIDAVNRFSDENRYEIKFPLEWLSKADIIREIKNHGFYDLCWYCESPTKSCIKPCGKCGPCKHHDLALLQLEKERKDAKEKYGELETLDKEEPRELPDHCSVPSVWRTIDATDDGIRCKPVGGEGLSGMAGFNGEFSLWADGAYPDAAPVFADAAPAYKRHPAQTVRAAN